MEAKKWKTFLAKTINLFFYQGCMKALGVIIEDTVSYTGSNVTLVGWSFTTMEGLYFISAPLVAELMGLMSHRTICVIGGFINGAGFILEGMFSNSVWFLFISNFLSGIGFGLLNLPTVIALSESFGVQYGTAISVCGLISNAGMVVLPPLLEFCRGHFGLTGALYLTGALLWNQILCGFLLPGTSNRPSSQQRTDNDGDDKPSIQGDDVDIPSNDKMALVPKQPNMIISHPALLPLIASQFFNMVTFMAWSMFLIPFGVSKGYKPSLAVYLSSIGGSGVIIGRTVIIFIFHFKLMSSLPVMLTPTVLLPCMLIFSTFLESFLHIGMVSFTVGICLGILTTWMFAYIRNVVCGHHFKSATALANVFTGIGVVITGLISGLILDIRGSYNDVFTFLASLGIFQACFMVPTILLTSTNENCEKIHQDQ